MHLKTDKMNRRRFLTELGTVAAALSLGRTAYPQMTPTQTRDEFLLYVGTYTTDTRSKGIYIYRFSTKDGSLRLHKTVGNVVDPSFLAIDDRNRYLYAVNETLEYEGKKSGAVSSFAIDQKTGGLTFLNKQPSMGGAPCHISITKDRRFALVANYVGGNLSVFPIEPSGKLKPASDLEQHTGTGPNKERQESAHAHSINLDRNNRFAAACDLGTDKVFIYKFDEQKGKLTANPSQPFFQTKPGAGPRHLAFHPNGNLAFVINELDSTVTSLAYDPARGTLKDVQTLSTLPPDWSGENSCAEIVVSPDGNFLYGSNRGYDTIVCYRIDQRSGKLNVIEQTSTGGKVPRNFTIDPTGRYLLAANQKSDNIVTFAIDRSSGKLRATGNNADVPAPVCLRLIPAFR